MRDDVAVLIKKVERDPFGLQCSFALGGRQPQEEGGHLRTQGSLCGRNAPVPFHPDGGVVGPCARAGRSVLGWTDHKGCFHECADRPVRAAERRVQSLADGITRARLILLEHREEVRPNDVFNGGGKGGDLSGADRQMRNDMRTNAERFF